MVRSAVIVWILSTLVCVGRGHHHEGHGTSDPANQDTTVDSSSNRVPLVKSANKEFAFRLYTRLANHADSQGKNIFFSPASVSVALAALAVGTRGETFDQLFRGLGFNTSLVTQADVNHVFHALVETANSPSQEDASQGTAVFVDNNFKPRPEFLEVLKQSYLADGFTVDFSKSTESADAINKYVGEKTHGKIDKMVDRLDESTVMYLLSYIYYKGKWATPFDPSLTREGEFTVDQNTKVPVQMMNMEDRFQVYDDQEVNTKVLHLPFNNSFSMLLMLPDNMTALESAICPVHIDKWLKGMQTMTYNVFLPKFSIKTSYSLNDILSQMGMSNMFSDQADLSGISEAQTLKVSQVLHKAALDVDEEGATAAAATGVEITLTSMLFTPDLKFDHPFMVLIVEHNTQDIWFMGKIMNPNI